MLKVAIIDSGIDWDILKNNEVIDSKSFLYKNKKIEINFFILLFYKKFSDSVWFYLSKACELSFRKKFTTLRPPILSCFVS